MVIVCYSHHSWVGLLVAFIPEEAYVEPSGAMKLVFRGRAFRPDSARILKVLNLKCVVSLAKAIAESQGPMFFASTVLELQAQTMPSFFTSVLWI